MADGRATRTATNTGITDELAAPRVGTPDAVVDTAAAHGTDSSRPAEPVTTRRMARATSAAASPFDVVLTSTP